ncbi:MAG: hypothetical protein U0637_06535 [Phycisphaerales bacterium]
MMSERPGEPRVDAGSAALRGEALWWRAVAVLLLVLGGVMALLLVREVRSHRADNERFEVLQRQVEALGGTLLGQRVDDLTLVGPGGEVLQTSFAGGPCTLVVLLSEHCGACEASAPAWAQVTAKLGAEGVRTCMVVSDSGSPPQALARWAGLAPHAARDAERTWLRQVPGVPAGVLVDSGGVVRRLWLRPISGEDVEGVVGAVRQELAAPPR